MKNKLLSLLLSVAMVIGLTACGNGVDRKAENQNNSNEVSQETKDESKDLKKVTFVLDWTPNTNHTGLYVAESKGYFAAEGLEVEIVQPPEDGASAMVASGKAQFGVSFQDSMAPGVVGTNALPTTAVAALVQHNTSGIISRKGEGMDKPKGMEGEKYATSDMPVEKAVIQTVIEKDDGDFDKIELVPSTVTDEVSALQSKLVDAIWVFYAWGGIATEVAGLETDYFAFTDQDSVFDYYTPVLIANDDFLQEQQETAKAFLRALKQGYEFAIQDPQAAADILCDASPELNPEMVQASQEYLKDQYKAEVEQWGYIDPKRWNGFYNWLNENDLTETTIPENTGFTNAYLPE